MLAAIITMAMVDTTTDMVEAIMGSETAMMIGMEAMTDTTDIQAIIAIMDTLA